MAKITLTARVKITGSNGTLKSFITQQQYDFTDKESRFVTDWDVESIYRGKVLPHYKVTIDSEDFWIPDCYTAEYDKPFPLHTTDKKTREYDKYSNDSEKDVYKLYKEMLGRTIRNTYRRELSYLYAKLLNNPQMEKMRPGINEGQ